MVHKLKKIESRSIPLLVQSSSTSSFSIPRRKSIIPDMALPEYQNVRRMQTEKRAGLLYHHSLRAQIEELLKNSSNSPINNRDVSHQLSVMKQNVQDLSSFLS